MTTLWIGIDVAKLTLDIYRPNHTQTIPNTEKAILNWIASLPTTDGTYRVVCEATGGYERLLVRLSREHNVAIQVEHPNKIRAFAKTIGQLAKTDRIDARLIFDYASIIQPTNKPIYLSENQSVLRDLLKRRNQLIGDKTRERSRLDKEHRHTVRESIDSHIDYLDQHIKRLDKEIDALAQQTDIQPMVTLLSSIPAVGPITALTLIAYLPELSHLPHSSLAALVGVAPFNRDSGRYRGKRHIQGGRSLLRKTLYMAALSSIRWNQPLSDFYYRLRAKGKCAKVALTAVMNKLIGMLSSVAKRQSPWVDNMT